MREAPPIPPDETELERHIRRFGESQLQYNAMGTPGRYIEHLGITVFEPRLGRPERWPQGQ